MSVPATKVYGLRVHGRRRRARPAPSDVGRSADALGNSTIRARMQAYEDAVAEHGLPPDEIPLA
jgi:hypothetical protein